MSNLLNASDTLLKIVGPEASLWVARDPMGGRRLKRAAERAVDSLTEAACALGRERRAHLRDAHAALREVQSCLQVLRGEQPAPRAATEEALALATQLQGEVEARARSA